MCSKLIEEFKLADKIGFIKGINRQEARSRIHDARRRIGILSDSVDGTPKAIQEAKNQECKELGVDKSHADTIY